MVIYLDVLIAVNLFVNYFLLLGTALLGHMQPKRLRILFGAFVGSLFSLFIFLPPCRFFITLLVKLMLAILLVFITFGFKSVKIWIKNTGIFFGVNFIFAGVMMALWFGLSPNGMFYNNGIVYFNISPIILILGTVLAYLVIRSINFLLIRKVSNKKIMQIMIRVENKNQELDAFIDTGNRLHDPFMGLPVVVCEFNAVYKLIPPDLHNFFLHPTNGGLETVSNHAWRRRIKLVPYNTVGQGGIIAAFEPDVFYQKGDRELEKKSVLVGITNSILSDGEFRAVMPEL